MAADHQAQLLSREGEFKALLAALQAVWMEALRAARAEAGELRGSFQELKSLHVRSDRDSPFVSCTRVG